MPLIFPRTSPAKYVLVFFKLVPEIGLLETTNLAMMFISRLLRGVFFYELRKNNGQHRLVKTKVLNSQMYVSMNDRGLSQELITYRIHEPFLTLLLLNEVREDDVILGLGSNMGYYVLLYCPLLSNKGKVIAIEPDSRSFSILKKNIAVNNFEKSVEILNVAIGPKKGRGYLCLHESFNLSSIMTGSEKDFDKKPKLEIEFLQLDDILLSESKVDIIRMDIEGYEFEVIQGMSKTLKDLRPRLLFIELHPYKSYELVESFFRTLEKFNYKIKWAIPRHLIDAMLEAPEPLLKGALQLIKGEIPERKFDLPEQAIDLENFKKKFCSGTEVYHVVFSKNSKP